MKFPEKWLQGASLGEHITSNLRLKIISEEIPRDTILTENKIASSFGTSRSPVREAFQTLSMEGLVRLERMGAVVLGLTKQDISELHDVRFLLENFSIQQIVKDFDENKAVKYHRILDMMEFQASQNDHIEFSYYDLSFHESIIIDANHKRILHLWNNIRHIILCLLIVATEKRFSNNKEQINPLLERHKAIVEVLLSQDRKRAQRVVEEHFIDTKTTVNNAYLLK